MSSERISALLTVSLLSWAQAAGTSTVAYWKFDSNTGISTASVGNAAIYNLTTAGGAAADSTLACTNPIPNPDTTPGFIGSPSANAKSRFTTGENSTYSITVGDATPALNLNNNIWTIEGWFFLTNSPGANFDVLFTTRKSAGSLAGIMLDCRNSGTTNVLNLFVNDDSGNASANLSPNVNITTGVWHHVALTYNGISRPGTEFEFFLDGFTLGMFNLTNTVNRVSVDANDQGAIEFGGRATGANNSFAGRLDEWRISDQVLTPPQFLNSPVNVVWTNSTGGGWSAAGNWTNSMGPFAGGAANVILNFNDISAAYSCTNDLNGSYLLNNLNIGTGTVTLSGNTLIFTNNSTTAPPGISNYSGNTLTIGNGLILATDTTFSTISPIIFGGPATGLSWSAAIFNGTGGATLQNVFSLTNATMTVGNAANGTLNVANGASLQMAGPAGNLTIGTGIGGTGGVYQTGGALTLDNALTIGESTYGFYQITNGTFFHHGTGTGSVVQAGHLNGGIGLFYQTGGSCKISNLSTHVFIGRSSGSIGMVYLAGGTHYAVASDYTLAAEAAGVRGEMTVAGSADVELTNNSVVFSAGTGILNLNGGTLTVKSIAPGTGTLSLLTFNGGTLRAGLPGASSTSFLQNLSNTFIYSQGAYIDTGTNIITINQPLLGPSGNGVKSLTLTANGSSYIAPPYVQISGGGGSGASAAALINQANGQVTNLIVTSPGFNYTGTPTITLLGGGGSGALAAATLGSSTSGGLTKSGAGTLILTGTNSFSGPLVITSGTLTSAYTNALGTSTSITVAPGAKLRLATNTGINSNAVLTLTSSGTNYGQLYLTNLVTETVYNLNFGQSHQLEGTWGSSGSPAGHTNDHYFAGPGVLNVRIQGAPGTLFSFR